MKLRVSLRPAEALGKETTGEVATACVDCGNGEQILRWLAFAACDRAAHLANLPSGTFVPQAVINREGVIEDVDSVIRARYSDGDGVVVRFSRGPEAFTARWEGRPVTPPPLAEHSGRQSESSQETARDSTPSTSGDVKHKTPGLRWLDARLDFEAFGIGELVSEMLANSRKDARAEDVAAARDTLFTHAGALQALFKLYESDGDVDVRDVDKMNLEQFRRFMLDAKAIEVGGPTITVLDVDACFNEALKKKGTKMEKELKGVVKTLDCIGFLVAVTRVAARKYDLSKVKSPDIGFAELHRRLDHFVETHVYPFLSKNFETIYADSLEATSDATAMAELASANRLTMHAMKMCMPRRPPGEPWSLFVHDFTKSAMEWGVLVDDDAGDIGNASKTLGNTARISSGEAEAGDANTTEDTSDSNSKDAFDLLEYDRDAPGFVDLHAFCRTVIGVRQDDPSDLRRYQPEESPARLNAGQFEKLLFALAWITHGKRVARGKRAEAAAAAAKTEAEERRRRQEAAEEGDKSDDDENDDTSDSDPNSDGDATKSNKNADAPMASAENLTTEEEEVSKFIPPPFAEHLRGFLRDIFHKTGVLTEASDGKDDGGEFSEEEDDEGFVSDVSIEEGEGA